jgi:RNA polymerase sigma-70 factor, ECF subfamily
MQRDLVARAREGDHDAFTSLVAVSIDSLYSTARLILRSDDLAEDAVQDALMRAWLGIRSLRDPDRFEAWIRRLTVHACYRVAKRERSHRIVEIQEIPFGGPATTDGQASLAIRDQLERGFRRLPPDQRAVLTLHYYLDLPDAEAADVLGVPIGTMKSRLNRATSALRAALEANDRQSAVAEGQTT